MFTWPNHVEDHSLLDDIEHNNDFVLRQMSVNVLNDSIERYLFLPTKVW